MSTDDYVSSNAAFLWCSSGNNNNNEAIRFPVLKGGNAAVVDYASAGPMFGAVGIFFMLWDSSSCSGGSSDFWRNGLVSGQSIY